VTREVMEQVVFCQAAYCKQHAVDGRMFCQHHLGMLAEQVQRGLERIDHRELLAQRLVPNLDTVGRLELCAAAIESIAEAEKRPIWNPYRQMASLMFARLRRAEFSPDPASVEAPGLAGLDLGESPRRGPWE
jgi:hypothetical protein